MRATRRVFLIEKKEIKEKFANEYNPYIRSSELKPTVDILFILFVVVVVDDVDYLQTKR